MMAVEMGGDRFQRPCRCASDRRVLQHTVGLWQEGRPNSVVSVSTSAQGPGVGLGGCYPDC